MTLPNKIALFLLCLLALFGRPGAASAAEDIGPFGQFEFYFPAVIAHDRATKITFKMKKLGSNTSFKLGNLRGSFTSPGEGGDIEVENLSSAYNFVEFNKQKDLFITVNPKGKFQNIRVTLDLIAQDFFGGERVVDSGFADFQVLRFPEPFIVVTPAANSFVDKTFRAEWKLSSGAESYDVSFTRVVNNKLQSAPDLTLTGVTATSIIVSDERIKRGTVYQMDVIARSQVGSRANTNKLHRFTIQKAPPIGQFQYVAPAADAYLVPKPVVSWTPATNADRYVMIVVKDTNGVAAGDIVRYEEQNANFRSDWSADDALAPGAYWVTVRAINETDDRAADGSPRRFVVTGLGDFSLIAPTETIVSTTPTFAWNWSSGAEDYLLQVFDVVGSTEKLWTEVVVGNPSRLPDPNRLSATIPAVDALAWGRSYRVRVTARRGTDLRASSGAAINFTLQPAPVFSLTTPRAGATDVPVAADFFWTVITGAPNYQVELYRIGLDGSVEPDTLQLSVLTRAGGIVKPFTTLLPGRSYYVRVIATTSTNSFIAINAGGYQRFTTSPLGAFSLTSPADNATAFSLQGSFAWNAAEGATGYRLVITPDGRPALPAFEVGTATSLSLAALGYNLPGQTRCTWRVEALAGGAILRSAETRAFTTASRTAAITAAEVRDHLLGRRMLSKQDQQLLDNPAPLDAVLLLP